ncbi:MAG: PfkB family carbohydrate kinase, partial [Spirochaetia bacterium]
RRVRIAVIGDFCLDAYWNLDASLSEISIETGLATRPVRSQRYSLGGAGNVVSNLLSLGVSAVSAFGVLGSDPFGREMLRMLAAVSVDTRSLLVQEKGWDTPVYIKPVEGEAEQGRIDFGNANRMDPAKGMALLAALRSALPGLDMVVVNQQLENGIHTEELRRGLAALIGGARESTEYGSTRSARRPYRGAVPFICDSRSFSDSYAGAMRKLNDREALRLCGEQWESADPVPRPDAVRAAETLFQRWKAPVFLTRGARGMLVRDTEGMHEVPGLQILGRIDTVGAGDSALAGIAAALATGQGCRTAASLGNLAAGVTVQKLFVTGTASPEEVMAIGADPDYVYHPELAADPRGARYYDESEIEIINAPPAGGFAPPAGGFAPPAGGFAPPAGRRITHAIFDNDGTISTLREGWETIMEPVMIRAILGEGWKTAEEKLFLRTQERVREYIDKTTGVQTLVQMQGLV